MAILNEGELLTSFLKWEHDNIEELERVSLLLFSTMSEEEAVQKLNEHMVEQFLLSRDVQKQEEKLEGRAERNKEFLPGIKVEDYYGQPVSLEDLATHASDAEVLQAAKDAHPSNHNSNHNDFNG